MALLFLIFFPFLCTLYLLLTLLLAHSLSLAPSLTSLSLSQLTCFVVFDPVLSFPSSFTFPLPSLLQDLQFFIYSQLLGNEGSLLKYGRCLLAGSQYRQIEKNEMRMETEGQKPED